MINHAHLIRFSVTYPKRKSIKMHIFSAKNNIFIMWPKEGGEHAKKKEKIQPKMIFFLEYLFTYLPRSGE